MAYKNTSLYKLTLILIILFLANSTFSQVNLNKSKVSDFLFEIPNDSVITTGNDPGILGMDLQFENIDYNSSKKILNIKGKIIDLESGEPILFAEIFQSYIDFEKWTIKTIETNGLGDNSEFNLEIKINRGQFLVFKHIAFHPLVIDLDILISQL